MKKIIICCLIIIGICGCIGIVLRVTTTDDNRKDIFYNQVLEDTFNNNTKMQEVVMNEVEVIVTNVEEKRIEVLVEAPNICEELIAWITTYDGNISEKVFADMVSDLIKETPRTVSSYEFEYEDSDQLEIYYTNEYMNAVSCGLEEFYNYAMYQVIQDMKEGATND